MRPTMDFPMARHFLRSWTYEVFWPRHVTSAETPREIVKVSNLQSRFTQNPCFISFIPVGSSWYSFVHKGSLLRVAYDLQPVVKCSWSFWSFAIPVELGESVEIECRNPDTRTYPIILAPLQFLTNGKNMTSTSQNIWISVSCCSLKLSPCVHETLGRRVVRCLSNIQQTSLEKSAPPGHPHNVTNSAASCGRIGAVTSWPQCSLPTKVVFRHRFAFFFSTNNI